MPFATNPALEAAVVADADNDLPRLVYADWLDEHGDPARAHFIRTQIALHDKHPADPDYPDLLEANREAFDAMHPRFDLEPKLPGGLGFYDDFHDPDSDSMLLHPRGYHRGFPHVAHLRDDMLTDERKAERVRAALPKLFATTVRGLFSEDGTLGELYRVLGAYECERLTAFGLDSRYTTREQWGEVTAVTHSPMAGSLRHLALSPHDDGDVLSLGDAGFPHLRRWECRRGFGCDPRTAEMLFNAGWFGRLRHLLCSLDAGEARAFWAACAANKNLHTLEIVGAETEAFLPLTKAKAKALTGLGRMELNFDTEYRADADVAALVRAKLPKVRAFKFTGGALRHDTHKELFAADWFARLRVLELRSGYLDDRTVMAVSKSAAADNLRSLSLEALIVSPKTLLAVAGSFPQLTTLDLPARGFYSRARGPDVRAFLKALALPKLRHLRLSGQAVGDPGAVALAKNATLSNLTRLTLDGTGVGDRGLRAMATSPHLQRVSCLDLSWTLVRDGADVLADPGVLPNLTFCWLPQEVSKKVMTKLRDARGDLFHDWGR